MKIVTIVGARPQFIKAATLSREIRLHDNINDIIIHTGQHFDNKMSAIFFEQMDIPAPDYNLNINGLSHGAMTGQMLEGIEQILIKEKPDYVLVYGDTNSTLAGALAASKLDIPVVHIESGLRSFNMKMPEEVNRILTDRISKYLFCPTQTAVDNLKREAFEQFDNQIIMSGDIMYDAALFYSAKAKRPNSINLPTEYILATVHRQENTDYEHKLQDIFKAFNLISTNIQVIVPIHPRTVAKIKEYNIPLAGNVHLIEPVGYFEMIYLIKNCNFIMTDSGGLQKEAYFFNKLSVTLREQTEWVELVSNNYSQLTGADFNKIMGAAEDTVNKKLDFSKNLFGMGNTAKLIFKYIFK